MPTLDSSKMKWLVTAFEPFNGASENSSLQMLRELEARNINPNLEFFAPVSVTYARAWPQVKEQIDKIPDLRGVLSLGQAENRKKISLERVTLNCIDASIADNDGKKIELSKVKDGPDMLWTNIPWENFTISRRVERSYSAGTFVCNALMFELMLWAQAQGKMAGFVHIPLFDSSDKELIDEAQRVMEFVLNL